MFGSFPSLLGKCAGPLKSSASMASAQPCQAIVREANHYKLRKTTLSGA